MALVVMRRAHVRPFEHSLLTRVLVGITIGLMRGGGAILAVSIFIYVISPMEVAAIEDIV